MKRGLKVCMGGHLPEYDYVRVSMKRGLKDLIHIDSLLKGVWVSMKRGLKDQLVEELKGEEE